MGKERYINPLTDFGFNHLFSKRSNKDFVIDFLHELLKEEQNEITKLIYLNPAHIDRICDNKDVIFDLFCTNKKGEKFIVELQKTKQKNFIDKSIYYSSFPIQEHIRKGSVWRKEVDKVYSVTLLDFIFNDDIDEKDKYRYDLKLSDSGSDKVFYDNLTFIFLEIPKFNKKITSKSTKFEKWMYILKNLHTLDKIPQEINEEIFVKLFETSLINKLSIAEHKSYEKKLNL